MLEMSKDSLDFPVKVRQILVDFQVEQFLINTKVRRDEIFLRQ